MATKKAVKAAPKAGTIVTSPFERVLANARQVFKGRSAIVGVEAQLFAVTIDEHNNQVKVPLATLEGNARTMNSGKAGFYLNGKASDPLATGEEVRYQIGLNITAIKSEAW